MFFIKLGLFFLGKQDGRSIEVMNSFELDYTVFEGQVSEW